MKAIADRLKTGHWSFGGVLPFSIRALRRCLITNTRSLQKSEGSRRDARSCALMPICFRTHSPTPQHTALLPGGPSGARPPCRISPQATTGAAPPRALSLRSAQKAEPVAKMCLRNRCTV